MPQRAIAAVYMRGGASKGAFLREESRPPPGRATNYCWSLWVRSGYHE